MPPRNRGVLFLNARAGSFSLSDESELRTRAYDAGLRVVDVDRGLDVRQIVRSARDAGLRDFVVAGGDGSIHHVAQALAGTDGILGILPIGTVNHLARDLELPQDWRSAFDVALGGALRQIDAGRVNGIYFLNSVMVGLYPMITEYREQFRSTHGKWRAYARAARLALRRFHHVSLVLEHDGRMETIRTHMFTVSVNSYDLSQGGIAAPKTTMEDGRLSIYTMSFASRAEFVRSAAKFFRGRIENVDGFRAVRTRQVTLDTPREKLRVSVDGELMDAGTPLRIEAVPAALLVRA